LNPECWLAESDTLFVAGEQDKIAPIDQVRRLYESAGPGNKMLVVPRAAHEPLPFFFGDLADPIKDWLWGTRSAHADLLGTKAGYN
jgi:hypothetical protein